MTCRCGGIHTDETRKFVPFHWHRLPWPVMTCDGTYRGEWFASSVGPGIPHRWKAVVAVIIYHVTNKLWAGAFNKERDDASD